MVAWFNSMGSKQLLICVRLAVMFGAFATVSAQESATNATTEHLGGSLNFYLVTGTNDYYSIIRSPLEEIPLEGKPFLILEDMVRYDYKNHSLLLTDAAYQKVHALHVPSEGKAFVVAVGERRIYCGAFWSPISSIIPEGVFITQPTKKRNEELHILLGLGTRKTKAYDPRNDPELLSILKDTGKT